ncbi:MAG: ATP-binding cassette domain-containing protein [Acidimicrobiales bacterium]|nr:ATP-binding cassette domain-containing protein [Acidimicrobiales bacterium]
MRRSRSPCCSSRCRWRCSCPCAIAGWRPEPMLRADIGVQLGDLDLAAAIDAGDGEVVALLGPNGAGKTTVLRVVAGLQPLDRGRVELGGRVLDDPATGTFVPPAGRPVGVVFQDHLLFPHMSALDNVAFGLRARGVGKVDARSRAARWLDRVGLADRADARPGALSGGQSQRVAVARALATEPQVLLLDEPLAAVDARTRVHMRAELRRHLTTFAGVRLLVTHDPVDALVLADRLVVIEAGRVTQHGTTSEVARRPRSRYVAQLVGLNLLHGTAVGEHDVRLSSGGHLVVADPLPAGEVAVAVRPQAVTVHRRRPEGSARNAWEARVVDLEADHDRVRVQLAGPVAAAPATGPGDPAVLVAEVTPGAVAELGLAPGAAVWATVKAVDLAVYER